VLVSNFEAHGSGCAHGRRPFASSECFSDVAKVRNPNTANRAHHAHPYVTMQ
jgi:hypothetical protein